nr:polyprenyl synthetase family protein [Propionispira raffinosivorans]
MSSNKMFDVVKEDLAKLEKEMLAVVQSPIELITEIGTHLVNSGGKRLRPALYFLAVRCGSSVDEKNIMPLAAAIEMIHMASLVHDDVIDSADMRRGTPTANSKWGNQISILSGDYLFAKAFSLIAKQNYSSRVTMILAQLICDLSEGEIIQNKETFRASKDKSEYYARIAKKTANFIAASCELGAIVAKLPEKEIDALRQYGEAIGMAFQITDDLLDLTATQEEIGKPAGNDILQGIVTLPVIHALEVSPNSEELQAILKTRDMSNDLLSRALDIVQATDAVEYARGKVDEYITKAYDVLPSSIPAAVFEAYQLAADSIRIRTY